MCYPAWYKDGSLARLASEVGIKWRVQVLSGSRGTAISCVLGHHWWPAPGNLGWGGNCYTHWGESSRSPVATPSLGIWFAERRVTRGMELCRNFPDNDRGWLSRGFAGVYQGGAAAKKQSSGLLPHRWGCQIHVQRLWSGLRIGGTHAWERDSHSPVCSMHP